MMLVDSEMKLLLLWWSSVFCLNLSVVTSTYSLHPTEQLHCVLVYRTTLRIFILFLRLHPISGSKWRHPSRPTGEFVLQFQIVRGKFGQRYGIAPPPPRLGSAPPHSGTLVSCECIIWNPPRGKKRHFFLKEPGPKYKTRKLRPSVLFVGATDTAVLEF